MAVLPIVERELRVAVRRYRTWLWRVMTGTVALIAFLLIYTGPGSYSSLSQVGHQVFVTLCILGTIYSLLAGPLGSTDCLARERREGTLGLLFLTDLRSYDVVLGKMTATSLNLAVGGAAALPLFATTVLMGGVSFSELGVVAVALLSMMFLSLSIGTLASAWFESSRAALGVVIVSLLSLAIGLIILGEDVLHIRLGSKVAPYFYMFCPSYSIHHCMNWRPALAWQFWLNIAGMHGLAWFSLAWACLHTRRSWQGGSETRRTAAWLKRAVDRLRRGGTRFRAAWRRRMLDRSPLAWLEGRDRLQSRILWTLCLGSAVFWALKHMLSPRRWPNEADLFLWPLWAHYVLCGWIAVQAPRRLADDKQSGALELLLCTPASVRDIVGGLMLAFRQRFGRTLLILLLLDASLALAFFHARGWGSLSQNWVLLKLGSWAAVVFAIQAYSLAFVSIYQGLVYGHSLRASFMVGWKLGVLPIVLFFILLFGYEGLRRSIGNMPSLREDLLISFWVGSHLSVCGLWLIHSHWRLRSGFRALAAQSVATGRLNRWLARRQENVLR